MWFLIFTFHFVLCAFDSGLAVEDGIKSYNGYKTYDLTIDTHTKFNFIKKYINQEGYDILNELHKLGNAHVMVEPKYQKSFENELNENLIGYEILHENVGRFIRREAKSRNARKKRSVPAKKSQYKFDHFPRYDDIVKFMLDLVQNSTFSDLIMIGNSSEGRPIYGIEVTKFTNKPVFFIDAGIHAREWASHVAAMYIMQQVVENEKVFVNRLNIVIIPCVNPDGYEYSHTKDRLWRKSRSQQGNNTSCYGVDLNRNFDSHWGEFRAEKFDSCHRLFAGPQPFSEPEAIALRDAILHYKPTAYLTLHSFGGYILYPYGFTKKLPPNWKTFHIMAYNVAERVKEFNGTNYKIGNSAGILYEGSGASDDWSMEKANVSIVFTMELPAYSNEPFHVPDDKIPDLVIETFEAFLNMFNQIYSYTLNDNNLL